MSRVITDIDDLKILVIDLLTPGVFLIEAYHLARLLGYRQQHAIRKQVLSDWKHIFEEDVDYHMVHDADQLALYETAYRAQVGGARAMKPERGRMFLTGSGMKKLWGHTSKTFPELEAALEKALQTSTPSPARSTTPQPGASSWPTPDGPRWSRAVPRPEPAPENHVVSSVGEFKEKKAKSQAPDIRGYEVLEKLLEHLKHLKDPALKELAILSAEVGLGRKLDDIRALVLEREPAREPLPPAPLVQPAPDLLPRAGVPAPPAPSSLDPNAGPSLIQGFDLSNEKMAGAELQTSDGPLLDHIPNVYYGLRQIGEVAGGYSAVQAGKAADIVAAELGYSHDDIRRKKLPFNDLPELPDTTSGKKRQMYRYDAAFSNRVIKLLRSSDEFTPGKPKDLGPFSQGGDDLPDLSRGPL